MSRSDQYMGLNEWAENFVKGEPIIVKVKGVRTYPDGKEVPFENEEEIAHTTTAKLIGWIDGAFSGEKFSELLEYTLADGRKFTEYVQAEPWSSGPCYFIALKENGEIVKESLWSEDEINNLCW